MRSTINWDPVKMYRKLNIIGGANCGESKTVSTFAKRVDIPQYDHVGNYRSNQVYVQVGGVLWYSPLLDILFESNYDWRTEDDTRET